MLHLGSAYSSCCKFAAARSVFKVFGSNPASQSSAVFSGGQSSRWWASASEQKSLSLLQIQYWNDLRQQDLVFGKQVAINRQQFSCRLLKVGTKEGVQNEWDDALNVVGEDDSLWNWGNAFCWGQDAPDEYEPYRAHRGYDSACYWDYLPAVTRTSRLGFRPALVPSPPTICPRGLRSAQRSL